MKETILFCLALLLSFHSQAQTVEVSNEKIKALIEEWNTAHNEKDISKFKNVYAPTVLFYGQKLSRLECLKKKSALFSIHKNFKQQITSRDLILTAYSTGEIKCDFIKEVQLNSKVKQYPSYLLLTKTPQGYLIVGESDEITDRNLGYKLNLGEKRSIINNDSPDSIDTKPSPSNAGLLDNVLLVIFIIAVLALFLLGFGWIRKNRKSVTPVYKTTPSKPSHLVEKPYRRPVSSPGISPDIKVIQEPVIIIKKEIVYVKKEDLKRKDDEPTNWDIGYTFEQYNVTKFPLTHFELLEWRSDKGVNGIYPKSNIYPDLSYKFTHKGVEKLFEVECKFRRDLFRNTFHIDPDQLLRYRDYQEKENIEVYLSLGLGGNPDSPKQSFLITLDELERLDYEFLRSYKRLPANNFFMNPNTLRLR